MKLTKINLIGAVTTELPIAGLQPNSRFIMAGADGLGPTEQVVSIGKALNQAGIFQNREPQNRELIIRIKLNPDWAANETPEDLRMEVYGLLAPPSNTDGGMTVEFFTLDPDNALAEVYGYVKKLEIVPFAKDPEVQVTIACTSPYLNQTDTIYLDPLSNVPEAENPGTAPVGFQFQILFEANMSYWEIAHNVSDDFMRFEFDFLVDDILVVDTAEGSRSIQIIRDSNVFSVIGVLSSDSTWLRLFAGLNEFGVSSPDYSWELFSLTPRYWGI